MGMGKAIFFYGGILVSAIGFVFGFPGMLDDVDMKVSKTLDRKSVAFMTRKHTTFDQAYFPSAIRSLRTVRMSSESHSAVPCRRATSRPFLSMINVVGRPITSAARAKARSGAT